MSDIDGNFELEFDEYMLSKSPILVCSYTGMITKEKPLSQEATQTVNFTVGESDWTVIDIVAGGITAQPTTFAGKIQYKARRLKWKVRNLFNN